MTDHDALAALLPSVVNFRFLPARSVNDPIWREMAADLHAAGVRVTGDAGLDVERLAEALSMPGVFEDQPDDVDGLAADIAREYAALAGDTQEAAPDTAAHLAWLRDGNRLAQALHDGLPCAHDGFHRFRHLDDAADILAALDEERAQLVALAAHVCEADR